MGRYHGSTDLFCFFVKGQTVNILGFASKEAKSWTLRRYLRNNRTDFPTIFVDRIPDVMIITEHDIFII